MTQGDETNTHLGTLGEGEYSKRANHSTGNYWEQLFFYYLQATHFSQGPKQNLNICFGSANEHRPTMEFCLLGEWFPIWNPVSEKVERHIYSCQGHEAAVAL